MTAWSVFRSSWPYQLLCQAGFRDRVLGNPRFLVVLAIEFAMGASAKWSAEVQARGDKFWPVRCRSWTPHWQGLTRTDTDTVAIGTVSDIVIR